MGAARLGRRAVLTAVEKAGRVQRGGASECESGRPMKGVLMKAMLSEMGNENKLCGRIDWQQAWMLRYTSKEAELLLGEERKRRFVNLR